MESSLSSIQSLVEQVKKELFSYSHDSKNNSNVYAFVSASAYETAWLAMVPDTQEPSQPMFKCCLSWVLRNQKEGGYWGLEHMNEVEEGDTNTGFPTLDALTATLACVVALRTWNLGEDNVRKGLNFIYTKAEMILKKNCQHHLPRWFTIAFPTMVELAQRVGLDVAFLRGTTKVLLHNIFLNRQNILQKENLVNVSPLLSHVKSLPSSIEEEEDMIMKHLSEDGSYFQSPSATAYAYMTTGNLQCLKYLKSVVQRCPNGVPVKYPMDEELVNLCMVDHVQRLGLSEHFGKEIQCILDRVYSHKYNNFQQTTETHNLTAKLFKDALSFRLLRAHGYDVKSCYFDWFLSRADMMDYIEQNCESLTSVLYAVYRATDLRFMGEQELEEARSFSRKLLEKSIMTSSNIADEFVIFPGLRTLIKRELSNPWISRLDRLDHRIWIEENKTSQLWIGKASFFRLSGLHNEKLMQLAIKNYNFRQSIYAKELEELTRWSSSSGFTEIGFGREKTAYCYFAISASSALPHDSIVRLLITKSAIIITVADDFYDMEGSLTELKLLTEAVQRWDGKNLSGHGKTIFNALDDLVTQMAEKYQHQHGINHLTKFRDIWKETFASWMVERTWSDSGYIPAMDEYLDTGMISIAIHTIVLPSSCFLCQSSSHPIQYLKTASEYAKITKLLMSAARLLNDTQSYQKEEIDGKMNLVLLHLKENPKSQIHDSVAYVKNILNEKTREFLEIVLSDDNGSIDDQMPKSMKQLHLSCLKVFHMFFNSTNLFDTKAELLQDIKRAIFIPISPQLI